MYNLENFKEFTTKIIDKKFKRKMNYSEKKALVDQILSSDTAKLSGRAFYQIVMILEEDLENTCKSFFKKHPATKLHSLMGPNDKFNSLFNPFINSKTDLSKASDIEINRLIKLFNEGFEISYACEVYGLAIATNKKPSELFEYFYG